MILIFVAGLSSFIATDYARSLWQQMVHAFMPGGPNLFIVLAARKIFEHALQT
jgi:hypothetical protein